MQPPSSEPVAGSVNQLIPLKDLATILIRHYGYHEGFYEVGVQFNIAVGSVGPDATQIAPGAVLTVGGIGLSKCSPSSPLGIDASVVNPAESMPLKKPTRKRTSM